MSATLLPILTAAAVTVYVLSTVDSALVVLMWGVLGLLGFPMEWIGHGEIALLVMSLGPAWLLFGRVLRVERELRRDELVR